MELMLMVLSAEHTNPHDFNHGRFQSEAAYRRRVLSSSDLNSLAQVNHKLHDIVNPVLYNLNRDFEDFDLLLRAVTNNNTHTLEAAKRLNLDMSLWDQTHKRCLLAEAFGPSTPDTFEWLINNGVGSFRTWLEDTVEREPVGLAATRTMLWVAVRNKWEDIAIILLKHGASRFFITSPGNDMTTVLHTAVVFNMSALTRYLLEDLEFPIDQRDSDNTTPLLCAITQPRGLGPGLDTVKLLIDHGADVNLPTDGEYPLRTAVRRGNLAYVDLLISAGADINACYAVHTCAMLWLGDTHVPHQLQMLDMLIDAGADLEAQDTDGDTPLQAALMCRDKKLATTRHLLAKGVSTSGILDFCVKSHEFLYMNRAVVVLMQVGVRIDQPLSSVPYSFIEWAALEKDRQLVDHLLTMATPDCLEFDHLDGVLAKCYSCGRLEMCDILVRHGARFRDAEVAYKAAWTLIVKSPGQYGPDPRELFLDMAISMGIPSENISCLITRALEVQDQISANHLLCRFGTGITSPDPQWLNLACKWGVIYIIQQVLKVTKDVNELSKDMRTPLAEVLGASFAIGPKGVAIARLLLHSGVSPFLPPTESPLYSKDEDWETVKNGVGVSAFEIAIRNEALLPLVKEMWVKAPPGTRPELKDFIACVPHNCLATAEWLKGAKDSPDHTTCPTDFLHESPIAPNLDSIRDWEDSDSDDNDQHDSSWEEGVMVIVTH
ncbi:ankyrin repeat-containing domain protein [Hypoxylon sp. FL1150]|nr:ankyrin repeat-containing domain protein [Hypoxylon sp. FL1150]